MKKYLLGIFALVLAVGFSAFSSNRSQQVEDELYWHPVDPGSGEITGLPVGPAYKTAMISGVCLDDGPELCFYGTPTFQDLIDEYVGNVTDEEITVKVTE